MNAKIDNKLLLKQLAVIMAEYPRYTMKELAESAGISKASIHRLYGTRENLQELIVNETRKCIENIIATADKQYYEYEKALENLIQVHFEYREFLLFARNMQLCTDYKYVDKYMAVMDKFFLDGKKQGFFKMDFDATTITELFISMFSGITDAERRGRVASALSRVVFQKAFLNGTANEALK